MQLPIVLTVALFPTVTEALRFIMRRGSRFHEKAERFERVRFLYRAHMAVEVTLLFVFHGHTF
jgi:hypothetical protein